MKRPGSTRFFKKVRKTDTCWLWMGSRTKSGYAMFSGTTASRYSYEFHVGPIPTGFQVDHLCRVRHCVNPDHLDAVTISENIRRQPPYTVAADGLGALIRGARKDLGLTQGEIGELVGVRGSQISLMERGLTRISQPWHAALAERLTEMRGVA